VRQVGYLPELYEDARSEKNIAYQLISLFLSPGINEVTPVTVQWHINWGFQHTGSFVSNREH